MPAFGLETFGGLWGLGSTPYQYCNRIGPIPTGKTYRLFNPRILLRGDPGSSSSVSEDNKIILWDDAAGPAPGNVVSVGSAYTIVGNSDTFGTPAHLQYFLWESSASYIDITNSSGSDKYYWLGVINQGTGGGDIAYTTDGGTKNNYKTTGAYLTIADGQAFGTPDGTADQIFSWAIDYIDVTTTTNWYYRPAIDKGNYALIADTPPATTAINFDLAPPTAGHTITVGLVSETDTPYATTRNKTRTPSIVSETDTVLAVTRIKTKTIGIVSETDTPQTLADKIKTKTPSIVSETDSVLAVTRIKTKTLGIVSETDSVLAVTSSRGRTTALGSIISETDSTFAVNRLKTKTPGIVSETDTVLGVTRIKTKTLGIVSETDTPLACTHLKTKTLGIVSETDTPQACTRIKTKTIGIVSETDSVFAIADKIKVKGIGIVSEVDTVNQVKRAGVLGICLETDTVPAVTRLKTKTLGIVSETDTPQGVTYARGFNVGLVSETDTVYSVQYHRHKLVGIVNETDTVPGVTRVKTKTLGLVTETATAYSVTHAKTKTLSIVPEVDTVFSIKLKPPPGHIEVGIVGEVTTVYPVFGSYGYAGILSMVTDNSGDVEQIDTDSAYVQLGEFCSAFLQMEQYEMTDIGDTRILRAEIRNRNGELTDPTTVDGWMMEPSGDITVLDFESTETGIWEASFDIVQAGQHHWRIQTAGIVKVAGERHFKVNTQVVVP